MSATKLDFDVNSIYNKTILIVEDNKDFLGILDLFLKKLGYEKIHSASTFNEGKRLFKSIEPDLVILDIDLGEKKDGIDLGHAIRQSDDQVPIVFITHNFTDDVYEEALEVRPSSFLNKELSMLKLRQAVELSLSNFATGGNNKEPHNPIDFVQESIFVKLGSNYKRVKLSEIEYFYYEDRYIHLVYEGHTFSLSGTMKDLIKALPDTLFIQIHQSFIVNINKIDKVNFTDNEVTLNEKSFPIGVRFKNGLISKLKFLK